MSRVATISLSALLSLSLLMGTVVAAMASRSCNHAAMSTSPAEPCPCCDRALVMSASCGVGCQSAISAGAEGAMPARVADVIVFTDRSRVCDGLRMKPPVPPPRRLV